MGSEILGWKLNIKGLSQNPMTDFIPLFNYTHKWAQAKATRKKIRCDPYELFSTYLI